MASSIIVSNPAILSAEPAFRGTRVPFKSLTDYPNSLSVSGNPFHPLEFLLGDSRVPEGRF